MTAQMQAEYHALMHDLGPWATAFDMQPEGPDDVTLRGPAETSTFRSGDVAVYRFGQSIMVHRRLSGKDAEAYFVLRRSDHGPELVRHGFIGREAPLAALDAMTQRLVDAARRAKA
jgi:hypothetical protein